MADEGNYRPPFWKFVRSIRYCSGLETMPLKDWRLSEEVFGELLEIRLPISESISLEDYCDNNVKWVFE